MTSGELRHRLAFDAMAPQSSDGGLTAGDWVEQFQARAGMKFLRGQETVMQSRLQGIQPVVVKVRSNSSTRRVTTGWRVRDVRNGVQYNIRAITPDERGFYIDMLCDAGIPANG